MQRIGKGAKTVWELCCDWDLAPVRLWLFRPPIIHVHICVSRCGESFRYQLVCSIQNKRSIWKSVVAAIDVTCVESYGWPVKSFAAMHMTSR